MRIRYMRHAVYGCLLGVGVMALAFTYHQHRYMQLLSTGHQALAEMRFDTQHYGWAREYWLARQDILLANQGLLAYRAKNLPRAAELFRQASQTTRSAEVKGQALYNLGRVFVELKEAEQAAAMFKATLRLNPGDREAKFNLERLYHFVLMQEGERTEVSLEQAPGLGDKPNDQGSEGQGRSKPNSDI